MPELGRTTIEFASGGQSEWLAPSEVAAWRLPFRFAVVQDTYRADMVDLYRDKSVWFRLFEFARGYSEGGALTIINRPPDQTRWPLNQDQEAPLMTYLVASDAIPDEDWDPPERIVVREDGSPVLVIATEYWANIGGPKLYHDSLTYSIYSNEDLVGRVMRFLADADAAAGWELARVAVPAPDPPPPTLIDKVFSWLRRHA